MLTRTNAYDLKETKKRFKKNNQPRLLFWQVNIRGNMNVFLKCQLVVAFASYAINSPFT